MQYYMYISVISYMLLLCILYTYVMQYYILYIVCPHPIQSRRCIMIIAYHRYVLYACERPPKSSNGAPAAEHHRIGSAQC